MTIRKPKNKAYVILNLRDLFSDPGIRPFISLGIHEPPITRPWMENVQAH
jgi:hypothetical protein